MKKAFLKSRKKARKRAHLFAVTVIFAVFYDYITNANKALTMAKTSVIINA